ncbi:MAG: response regulator [Candidatus Rokuibacteriota bacterium]
MVSELSSPIRILIVDDHPMVREGLRSMLSGDIVEVVGEAGDAREAIRLATELRPDLVLLDVELPDMDGLAVLRRIKDTMPRVPVLVVTMHDEPARVREAVTSGAAGYVLKGVGRRELLAAVRAVCNGESVLEPRLLQSLVAEAPRPPGDRQQAQLTPVEREVLRLVAAGLTNREIGERMRWSLGTAKKYVQRVLERLDVSDRTQAAVVAVRQGLLD